MVTPASSKFGICYEDEKACVMSANACASLRPDELEGKLYDLVVLASRCARLQLVRSGAPVGLARKSP
jgi:hypothetical protein